jgi:hypothetical protein
MRHIIYYVDDHRAEGIFGVSPIDLPIRRFPRLIGAGF